MLGAHIDTWHAATGATDDGVGVAAMMEAMRILKATGVKLRRTVRIGLWDGEEQGLIGSREYVAAHFASRQPVPAAPGRRRAAARPARRLAAAAGRQGPLEFKPDYDKFSVYFNIDNGTGALRGIYLQGNDAAAPIFREWMEPFRSLGMTTVTIRNTGRHRPPVVRRGRTAGLPVHPGRGGVQHASRTTPTWTRTSACSRTT